MAENKRFTIVISTMQTAKYTCSRDSPNNQMKSEEKGNYNSGRTLKKILSCWESNASGLLFHHCTYKNTTVLLEFGAGDQGSRWLLKSWSCFTTCISLSSSCNTTIVHSFWRRCFAIFQLTRSISVLRIQKPDSNMRTSKHPQPHHHRQQW